MPRLLQYATGEELPMHLVMTGSKMYTKIISEDLLEIYISNKNIKYVIINFY